MGAYAPALSDVDVAVLHRSEMNGEQRRALVRWHQDFGRRYAAASWLDVRFVPLRLVGTYGEDTFHTTATAVSIRVGAAT